MKKNGYYWPETCKSGQGYYLKIISDTGKPIFRSVIFLDYRPHPGEVLVRDGKVTRKVYRLDLFTRKSN